jgi:AraC family transcriptional regulator, transcriptional activator of pobA
MTEAVGVNTVKSVTQYHQLCGLGTPLHPLVSVVNLDEIDFLLNQHFWKHYVNNLYSISIKRGMESKLIYGQTPFDFDGGVLVVTAPKQLIRIDKIENIRLKGFKLVFHPDLLKGYSLAKSIHKYGFFSYTNHRALFVSEKEEQIIMQLFASIRHEIDSNIDKFSQDVLLANIELLLVHIDRYYNRQFITRKHISNDTLLKMEEVLNTHFEHDNLPLITVQNVADQLNMSPTYLSDLLKNLTGLTVQQHIHEKLIEKAKELLSTTHLTVSEIAFQLGFEYPQSFNKLFKKKTQLTPLEYKGQFNS